MILTLIISAGLFAAKSMEIRKINRVLVTQKCLIFDIALITTNAEVNGEAY